MLPSNWLVFFIDESGDPTCRDPANPVFVVAGCGLVVSSYENELQKPWAEIRRIIKGNSDAHLHATNVERQFKRTSNRQKLSHLEKFFEHGKFARIAVIIKDTTKYTGHNIEDVIISISANSLIKRIENIARWNYFIGIACIFEDSKIIKRWERALQNASFFENGLEIPLEFYALPKSAGESGLEVADFLAHSVAGHLRAGRSPTNPFANRYASMFSGQPANNASLLEINEADVQADLPS